jgi:hypothetical protein
MTRVEQDGNGCEGDSWRMVGVNQTDDDKRSNHGKHCHSETAAKKLAPVPTAAPQTEPTINAYG